MALKQSIDETQARFEYPEHLLNSLVFETFGDQRYTQDSPIMPEVWMSFARAPRRKLDLLLTPRAGDSPGKVTKQLAERLAAFEGEGQSGKPEADEIRSTFNVAYSRSSVVAEVDFRQLVCVIVPMTAWWQKLDDQTKDYGALWTKLKPLIKQNKTLSQIIIDAALILKRAAWDVFRFCALVGLIVMAGKHENELDQFEDENERETRREELHDKLKARMKGLTEGSTPIAELEDIIMCYGEIARTICETQEEDGDGGPLQQIFMITENRDAQLSITESRCTVKADAANYLFNIDTSDLAWAVIDSGIDAQHPAFINRKAVEEYFKKQEAKQKTGRAAGGRSKKASGQRGKEDQAEVALTESVWSECLVTSQLAKFSRVRETYDFTYLRRLLATKQLPAEEEGGPPNALGAVIQSKYAQQLDHLKQRTDIGREIDWEIVAPLIRIPHDDHYYQPKIGHGTHVAGILGSDWKAQDNPEIADLIGICPQIRLYDLRVFKPNTGSDEFTVQYALQFVEHLNRNRELPLIHGVNLSLSMLHKVMSFACGRTPVCDECNGLVGTGVVVVVAAGNEGYKTFKTDKGDYAGYHATSITDPGNAEDVITVGATHRSHPHNYGVSYFSSRGPTGDGRRKPDLVAPGEKITAPVVNCGVQRMDGTSMAAPHVSGAAALLMARHRELIANPRRIKEILCRTATDLGREPHFQGGGMLDILRALQSV